jgi:hypothetical protein
MRTYKKLAAAVLIGSLFISSACQKQDKASGPNGVNAYSKDGYLGITDANPNMPTSPTYHTYSDDVQMMKSAIRQIPQVRSSSVTLNGPVAIVKLNVPQHISETEREKIRQEALSRLTMMMPRYSFQVSVSRR